MPARVRMPGHAARPQARSAQRRFHPNQLIFATGDRSPRSPRHANALGLIIRGFFIFGVRKGLSESLYRDCIALPKHPGFCWPEAGKTAKALHAPCLDASARAAARCTRNELAFLTRRQCGTSFKRSTAAWVHLPIRCARRCRGVCRGSQEGVPRKTMAERLGIS